MCVWLLSSATGPRSQWSGQMLGQKGGAFHATMATVFRQPNIGHTHSMRLIPQGELLSPQSI